MRDFGRWFGRSFVGVDELLRHGYDVAGVGFGQVWQGFDWHVPGEVVECVNEAVLNLGVPALVADHADLLKVIQIPNHPVE